MDLLAGCVAFHALLLTPIRNLLLSIDCPTIMAHLNRCHVSFAESILIPITIQQLPPSPIHLHFLLAHGSTPLAGCWLAIIVHLLSCMDSTKTTTLRLLMISAQLHLNDPTIQQPLNRRQDSRVHYFCPTATYEVEEISSLRPASSVVR